MDKEQLKGKYILAFDTVCSGWECVRDENNNPFLYDSAEEDKMDENDFVIPAEESIENRKAFFTVNGGGLTGNQNWYAKI